MAPTNNHQYNTPAKGTADWDVPLNDNFTSLDTDIEIRDQDANKGNYDPKSGAKFVATDTEAVYIGDGTNWNQLQTSGTEPNFDTLNSNGGYLSIGDGLPTPPVGSENFLVSEQAGPTDYVGMYLNGSDPDSWPFYGYSAGGSASAWHEYQGDTGKWQLYNGGYHLTVEQGGNVGIGETSPTDTLDVSGAVNASQGFRGNVGAEAFLSADQTVAASGRPTVAFDTAVADPRGEFDTSTGNFICAYDGAYHVEASISAVSGSLNTGQHLTIEIRVNGNNVARNDVYVNSEESPNFPSFSISKTLYGLTNTDAIDIAVDENSGSSFDIYGTAGGREWTYLSVHQVG